MSADMARRFMLYHILYGGGFSLRAERAVYSSCIRSSTVLPSTMTSLPRSITPEMRPGSSVSLSQVRASMPAQMGFRARSATARA